MVDWSKRAEEGIMARNSFCEWNVFLISTMQKEFALEQAIGTFGGKRRANRVRNYLLC